MTDFPQAFPQAVGSIPGMTLHDYFAAVALMGLLCGGEYGREIVERAYRYADQMLEERARDPELRKPVAY